MTGKARGRPRDPRVDEAVSTHLLQLMAERGPSGFSMDELAARSGVGKAAIYRRYRSREEMEQAGLAAINEDLPDVSDLPVRQALVTLLTWLAGSHAAGMTPTWLLAMQRMPAVRDLYRAKISGPRIVALMGILQRGQADGVLRGDLNLPDAMRILEFSGHHGRDAKDSRGRARGHVCDGRSDPPGDDQSDSRQRFVIGKRRSRPNARNVIFVPGGYWRRFHSAASVSCTIRATNSWS